MKPLCPGCTDPAKPAAAIGNECKTALCCQKCEEQCNSCQPCKSVAKQSAESDDLASLKEMMDSMESTPAPVPQNDQLTQLVAEIKILSQQTAANIIEIGKRLIAAKEQVGHGRWGNWLEENFEMSQKRATQFMNVASEFSNLNTYSNLNPSKVIALLDVPAADRENFITTSHEVSGVQKTVDEMTSRELDRVIKELKRVEQAKADSDKLLQDQAKRLQNAAIEAEQARGRELNTKALMETKESVIKRLKDENQKLEKLVDEIASSTPEPVEKIVEKEVIPAYIQTALDQAKSQVQILEAELAAKADPGDRRDDIAMRVDFFTARIKSFIRDMAALGYLGHEFARVSPKAQKEYSASLSALEKWCRDMRDSAIIPKEDNVITIDMKEVG